jgi:hypothetical protein
MRECSYEVYRLVYRDARSAALRRDASRLRAITGSVTALTGNAGVVALMALIEGTRGVRERTKDTVCNGLLCSRTCGPDGPARSAPRGVIGGAAAGSQLVKVWTFPSVASAALAAYAAVCGGLRANVSVRVVTSAGPVLYVELVEGSPPPARSVLLVSGRGFYQAEAGAPHQREAALPRQQEVELARLTGLAPLRLRALPAPAAHAA